MQNQISLADILSEYGEEYISRNNIKDQQKGIIRLLSSCGTMALGSHFQKCSHCCFLDKAYNSCRNRHCPFCQQKDKDLWLEKRMNELLPVGYYHLVFTIPHELNHICLKNKKVMYDILFKAASETILELAKDVKHLGANTGLITVLHTWGQNMMEHPHLHCIMPAGGLSFGNEHWVHADKKDNFFVHYKVLSRKFRGKFLASFQKAFDNDLLAFCKAISSTEARKNFLSLKDKLYKMEWVVNIQAPFNKPEKVLEYLSRYVFRIAITNRRIIEIKDGKVLFSWKDYRSGRFKKMRLDIDEFIRRFLLHVLPQGFFKVRYYGIFACRRRTENIKNAKKILKHEQENQKQEDKQDGCLTWQNCVFWENLYQRIQNYKKPNCSKCKKGYMRFAGLVPADNRMPG